MKRLVIITVGKTHSGKTTFARMLEDKLENSFVMDQDNHAEFIHTYYKKIEPKQGPNTLKHSISKLIVTYAKEQTNLHFIICNSNRTRKDREYLLEELYPEDQFTRILVHFDIPDAVLEGRVKESRRSTTIFRSVTTFENVLIRQQEDKVDDPVEGEADHLFVIKNDQEMSFVIQEIMKLSNSLKRHP
ncbi:AAA family ATPase [Bacillus suaedaesalsae]|uniref:AAA family ATPase n=1 Tax=Bacillus suaedaesalsae TaxID=2810349 RepID=A0ABS2DHP0_9BACI|nr:AAA family ATPase [Bacillus suaedaesalsae]MBM6618004.1 AAA family ATPase [Bacillus suaedaesalsae]